MEWTGVNDLREKFLKFYESKGHVILPSAPLVPRDDNSLLLINSGMAPLKKYFTGMETPPKKRATSCQKCIRTPDIERVGKTARHGTYFEMLGNFSFGDYFKREAIHWAWEFITTVIELPVDKVWATIYEDDDETRDIWVNEIGISPDHIVRLGKEDNFWEIGSGPCGPCSELYYDRGPEFGCGSPDCKPGCDCDRYMEFWNLVFSQFDGDGHGNYTPLAHPNIDTGMGLERLACIMQGVDNLFEVDTVQNIMKHICRIAGCEYKKDHKTDVSLRVVTDHIRSTVMMISDGIVPSNEGRGYVLRRLLRRAARHGRLLGIHEPFLYKVCDTVIEENKRAYPQLETNRDYITKIIKVEEERFAKTIDSGMELLTGIIDKMMADDIKNEKMPGDMAFKLYDTFGFPIDLTREILEERKLSLDEDTFQKLMEEQRERARKARAKMGDLGWEEDVLAGLDNKFKFTGYETLKGEADIVAMVNEGQIVDEIIEGQKVALVLNETPFYAESGGQTGDCGIIYLGKNLFNVVDTQKSPTGQFLHIGFMENGSLHKGDRVVTTVLTERRQDTMKNHSAAHLLQYALREVLGTHVHQAGQLVDKDICRFDFNHFSPMTTEEIKKVENLVNELILSALPVTVESMGIEEARQKGAMALFSEKYGDVVRVVSMGGKSIELCGGTHVSNTSEIGLFKIVKESSVAAGVRRIEAVTGRNLLKYIENTDMEVNKALSTVKAGALADLTPKIEALVNENKAKDKEIEMLNGKLASGKLESILATGKDVAGVKMLRASFNDMKVDALRTMGDKIKDLDEPVVAVLSSSTEEKGQLLIVASKKAVKLGVHSGKMVKSLTALAGGSGGGRPDSAMGGYTEVFKIDEIMAGADELLESMLNK